VNILARSPGTFMVSYSLAYASVFFMNRPLFLYYPLHSNFNWGSHAQTGIGPAMAWYGLMASAGLIALVVSLCVPDRAVSRFVAGYAWLAPVAAMLTSVFLLRRFLF
jgi:hypothetical protein